MELDPKLRTFESLRKRFTDTRAKKKTLEVLQSRCAYLNPPFLSRRARVRKKTWLETSCPPPRCGEGPRVRRETRQAKGMGTKMHEWARHSRRPPSLLAFFGGATDVTRRRVGGPMQPNRVSNLAQVGHSPPQTRLVGVNSEQMPSVIKIF